jgi:hypothetical protein
VAARAGGRREPGLFGRRTPLVVDGLVAVWAIAWLILGAVAYQELRELRQLSDTVVEGSEALEQTGQGLRQTSGGLRETGRVLAFLEDLPFAGDIVGTQFEDAADEIDRVAAQVEDAAESARLSGEESRDTVDEVALIVGLAIGLVPSILAVAGYLPFRSRRVRRALGFSDPAR